MCIRHELTNSIASPKPHNNDHYTLGGVSRTTADDKCIDCKISCGYIFLHEAQYGVGFVPLPKELRRGCSWNDLHFWVLPGKHDAKAV